MFSFIPKLAESETYVKGRRRETAVRLLEAAGKRGLEVRTTSHGYIVPTELLPEDHHDLELYVASDRPAVPTEPNTSTNVEEVHNAGQAATAAAGGDAATEDSDPAAGEDNAEEKAEQFDPSKATIAEIEDYFDGADEAERARVLAAEAAGKNRKGVLDLAETSEGDK
jgi:hypothetical protein